MHRVDLSDGAVRKGCVYLVPLMESLALPAGVSAVANAKSSTEAARPADRALTDGGVEFDRIPEGYTGPLYAEICPRSFRCWCGRGCGSTRSGSRAGSPMLEDAELTALRGRAAGRRSADSQGLGFSVDLRPATADLVGYRAKPHAGVIDLDRIDALCPRRFLGGNPHLERPDHPRSRRVLHPRQPGIGDDSLITPPKWRPIWQWWANSSAYAGFFDPGFGHGATGGELLGVLEVRCHEAPFVLEHGQVVGRLVYERMAARLSSSMARGLRRRLSGTGAEAVQAFPRGLSRPRRIGADGASAAVEPRGGERV